MASMTINQRKRMVAIMIAVVGVLLAAAVLALGPAIFDDARNFYSETEIAPEFALYCPGDTLRFQYTLDRERPGPVRIVRSWCRREDGICTLSNTVVEYGIVARRYEPLTVTGSRVIPDNEPRMVAGSVWEYLNAVESLGGGDPSWYSVPFTIAEDCPS